MSLKKNLHLAWHIATFVNVAILKGPKELPDLKKMMTESIFDEYDEMLMSEEEKEQAVLNIFIGLQNEIKANKTIQDNKEVEGD